MAQMVLVIPMVAIVAIPVHKQEVVVLPPTQEVAAVAVAAAMAVVNRTETEVLAV